MVSFRMPLEWARTWQGKQTCETATRGLLVDPREETGTSSTHLGMEYPAAAVSGEVEACRGGAVVEAGVEATLNNLAEVGLLIYPRGWLQQKMLRAGVLLVEDLFSREWLLLLLGTA